MKDSTMKNQLKKDKEKGVQIIGFGTFSIVKRAARAGINPQTGEKIKIKGRNAVTFKPSKNLP